MLARAQMTIRDEADVVIRSTAPASPVTDMLWLDTSSTPHQLKRWNGSAWVACGANVDLSAYYTKTEMDTKIEQTNSAIALKADSSTVSSLGDRLSQAEQKITPEGIAASVTSAAYYAYEKYSLKESTFRLPMYLPISKLYSLISRTHISTRLLCRNSML